MSWVPVPGEPQAALLIIGAEVLAAKVVDANGPFLLRALRDLGVAVREIRTLGDEVAAIAGALAPLSAGNDFVLTTGGIGPTHDDVTLAGVAAAFGLPLRPQQTGADGGAQHLQHLPEGTQLIWNAAHTVPVVQVRNVFVLPGVPEFVQRSLPQLAPLLRGRPFCSRQILLQVGEPEVAAPLAALQREFADVSMGSYPRFDAEAPYRVKLTLDGRDPARVSLAHAALLARLPHAWLVGGG